MEESEEAELEVAENEKKGPLPLMSLPGPPARRQDHFGAGDSQRPRGSVRGSGDSAEGAGLG